jgi:hypothetical protein
MLLAAAHTCAGLQCYKISDVHAAGHLRDSDFESRGFGWWLDAAPCTIVRCLFGPLRENVYKVGIVPYMLAACHAFVSFRL